MASLLNPYMTPLLLTGLLMVGLAVALWIMDFKNIRHRVFGGYIALLGVLAILPVIRFAVGSEWTLFFAHILPYLGFATIPLAILFVSYYPHPRGPAKWRFTPIVALAITVAVFLWYMLDHSAYGTIEPAPEGVANNAGSGYWYASYGPLFPLVAVRLMVSGILAVILARDYWKAPLGSGGFSRFLVSAGFTINALFNGMNGLTGLINDVVEQTPFPWLPFGWVHHVFLVLNIPLGIAAAVYMHRASRLESDEETLQEPRRFVQYILPFVVLSGIFLSYDPFIAVIGFEALVWAFALWKMVIPILITYALLRFQVFGADVRIKHSVAKAMLVGIFTVIFLVVLEAAEALLGDGAGFWVNILLAAFLAIIAAPLQNLASRAADKVMPDTKSVVEQDPYERGEFYMSQYELVLEDGEVSRKDREMLDRLALSLRISNRQQKELERGTNNLPAIKGYTAQLRAEELLPKTRWSRSLSVLMTAALFGAVGQGLESLVPADSFGFSLIGAAFITLAIGPIESLSAKLLEPADERRARHHRVTTYRNAVMAAFVDGNITMKERQYLDRLQKQLGLTQVERIQIHLRTAKKASA